MLGVMLYVVMFTILMNKGYQETIEVTGTTSIKVKGSGSIGNESESWENLLPVDAMDTTKIDENALFVWTSR